MLHPELGDASLSEQHFRPKQAYQNSIIPYYSTKPFFQRNRYCGSASLRIACGFR
ncbi:hypothetical protein [Sodalis sp. (in: enterobacteria)]|uniref:hypothetical protein n=1 Tax=Sodalis sp. (in: enterobacteria) TaxID=1898979 RepID=UPI003F2E3EE4